MEKFSREEVFNESLKYFNGDSLAAEVWINKYCLKDSDGNLYEKSPDDMHKRLAKELARIEKKYPNPIDEETIYNSLKNFKRIVPQGSPMTGIGNDFQIISLGNCFVIGNDSDSYGGILRVDEEQAQLMKRRGGVGHDLSKIRPEGTPVKNSALTSTGVVPFMERYSNSTIETAQSGRRGALMLSISINHPDAEAFIDAKLKQGKVTGANVSVKITDEFMNAINNNEDFWQIYPIDYKIDYNLIEFELGYNELYEIEKGVYIKKINPKKLWNKIVHNAWKSAEPGILFWDRVREESIPSCYGKEWEETSTNPCFSGNEKLLTTQGYKTFEELCDLEEIEIINYKGNISKSKVWKTGVKNTIKLHNTQKDEFVCTPDHKWMTNTSEEVEAKDLKGKRLMPFLFENIEQNELFVKLGFIQGDGGLCRLLSETHKGFEINIGKNDEDVLNFFGFERGHVNQRTFYTDEFFNICKDLEFHGAILPERNLPKTINNWTNLEKLSFLSGLYSANGSIITNQRISFKSTNKTLIIELQKLLNEFDISTYYTTNKPKKITFSNGEYLCKESYDLNIGKYYDLIKFYNTIRFIHKYKNEKLKELIINKSPKITKIEENGEIDVYDFIEPEYNWGVVNGYVGHNCGELPLNPYDSCRLLAINLYSYVENPFTENAKFNEELFNSDVILAQRYMDDIIDLELEKINQIIQKIESDPEPEDIKLVELKLWKKIKNNATIGRRTGLGVTGEGDMLAAMGLTYGTDSANIFSEAIHKQLKLQAYRSSVQMAKERGAFRIYDPIREEKNPFILRIKNDDPKLYQDMVKYGRRNIALLTIAPTGTVSLMTQTTSGIECVFLPVYKRRRKINPNDKDVRIDYVDETGIAWMEYPVFHHKFEEWLKINNYDVDIVKSMKLDQVDEIVKKSPYYKATSNDVDWVKKIEMQGLVQKHVDHSISVTVNLPNEVTEDIVAKVYETGWSVGCKGVTVYRDGSRSGILISDDDKKKKEKEKVFKDNHAPKRPKRLKADIVRFQNNLEKWIAVVGMLDGRPYEIFTGRLENGLSNLSPSITECEVVKKIVEDKNGNKSKRYDIEYIDTNGDKVTLEGLSHIFAPEYWNYAKLISGVLRHGMPMGYVYQLIRSLNLHDEHLNTWKAGIERVIKRFIKDGEKGKGHCPNCGSDNLEFKEGCLTCMSCGYSGCG